jgi:hypothetical protein
MPIFGKGPPRPPAGVQVPMRQRESLDILRKLSQMGGGRGVMWSPSGPQILQPGTTIRLATSSGIAKRTTTTLTYATATDVWIDVTTPTTAVLTTSSSTFTAFNISVSQDVPSGYIICELLWGIWIVTWADCP